MSSLLVVLGGIGLTGVIGWAVAREASHAANTLRRVRHIEHLRALEKERQRRVQERDAGLVRLQQEQKLPTMTR